MEMITESQANEAVTVTSQLPTDTSRKASGNCHYNHIACVLFLLMMSHGMLIVKHSRQARKEKCSILSVNLLVTKTCTQVHFHKLLNHLTLALSLFTLLHVKT